MGGDVVYVDRMLGVLPFSNTRHWLETFAEMERLAPVHIVPGHGRVTDLGKARVETRDDLSALRAHMRKAVDEGADISTAIKGFDAKPFMHLLNATKNIAFQSVVVGQRLARASPDGACTKADRAKPQRAVACRGLGVADGRFASAQTHPGFVSTVVPSLAADENNT